MKKSLLLLSMLVTLLSAKDVYMIGYVPPYRIQSLDKMDISGLTHVIAAFANPDSTGDMSCPIDLTSFTTKVKNGGSSPVISIGGGGSYSWGADTTIYEHLYADSNRAMFVNKLIAYAKEYDVAGIDVDIEGTPLMHDLYDPFVRELADSLHANGLEIYSAFGVGAYAGAGYVDDETLLKFDIIGTMSYGGVGPWNWEKQEDQATFERFKKDVQYFIDRGVDPSKIAGGVPFYSVGYPSEAQDNYSAYFHTLDQLYNDEFYTSQNPFYNDTLINEEGNPEYCNSFPTMKKKIDHMDKFKGGIMIWELGQDNYSSEINMLDSMIGYINEGVDMIESSASMVTTNFQTIEQRGSRVNLRLGKGNYTIRLFDVKGRVISKFASQQLIEGAVQFDLHSLQVGQGVYLLDVQSSTGNVIREKLVF